ncbi:uroporphyrinogen-III synthase [Sphingomonas sp.]|uniref:uroporphyrinogen-III synthase n=1 Tax=Sphingomonas sp. TaxID=28214 RepID=UPI003CC53C66
MIGGAVVLRPEPGSARTAALLTARGIDVRRCPLFAVTAVPWMTPDPRRFDALLLTSVNAPRHAGEGLRTLARLPVLAVGSATAAAAKAAGLTIVLTGDRDAATLVAAAAARGFTRLLHLAGRNRLTLPGVDQRTVYAAEPIAYPAGVAASWTGRIALLHSPRAARRFAALVAGAGVDRAAIAVAALSAAVAEAAGDGWSAVTRAATPTDAALVAAAAALIDRAQGATDKRA